MISNNSYHPIRTVIRRVVVTIIVILAMVLVNAFAPGSADGLHPNNIHKTNNSHNENLNAKPP